MRLKLFNLKSFLFNRRRADVPQTDFTKHFDRCGTDHYASRYGFNHNDKLNFSVRPRPNLHTPNFGDEFLDIQVLIWLLYPRLLSAHVNELRAQCHRLYKVPKLLFGVLLLASRLHAGSWSMIVVIVGTWRGTGEIRTYGVVARTAHWQVTGQCSTSLSAISTAYEDPIQEEIRFHQSVYNSGYPIRSCWVPYQEFVILLELSFILSRLLIVAFKFAMAAVSVAQNYGALLLGGLLAFRYVISLNKNNILSDLSRSLSGCVGMQFIVYWRLYPDESYRTKLLVWKSDASSSTPFTINRISQVSATWYVRVLWHGRYMPMDFRLLDLCHSAFVAIAIWDSIITPYGDFDMMDTIPWYKPHYYMQRMLDLMHLKECWRERF